MAVDTTAGNASSGRLRKQPSSAVVKLERSHNNPVPVMLALQGGGAHSAFTWGVLDYLLERQEAGDIKITALSGTSGGAVNAALVADGLRTNPARARQLLDSFWFKNSLAAALSFNPLSIPVPIFGSWNIDYLPWVFYLNSLSLAFSPYQFLPRANLFALAVASSIDFKALNKDSETELYVLATNARTGRWKTFKKGTLSVDAILASACLPNIFPAIIFQGDPYWDGGYLKDPGLSPLVNSHKSAEDILIIGVNPFERPTPYLPRTAREIADRINELSFNSSLMAEVEKVLLVNDALSKGADITSHSSELTDQEQTDTSKKKPFHIHYLEPHGEMVTLGVASKSNGSYFFARHLFNLGRQAASDWWPKCMENLGQRSTDLHKIVDYKHVESSDTPGAGMYQAVHHFFNGIMGSRAVS